MFEMYDSFVRKIYNSTCNTVLILLHVASLV